jgi:hypothetical protein
MVGGDEVPGRGRRLVDWTVPRLLVRTNHRLPHPKLWNMWITLPLRPFQKPLCPDAVTGDSRASGSPCRPVPVPFARWW